MNAKANLFHGKEKIVNELKDGFVDSVTYLTLDDRLYYAHMKDKSFQTLHHIFNAM